MPSIWFRRDAGYWVVFQVGTGKVLGIYDQWETVRVHHPSLREVYP